MQTRLALVFILVTVTLDSMGVGLIFPVLPDLIEEITGRPVGESALWGGVLATSFALMQFLFGPVVGNISDRFGRRPVMLVSLAVIAADYVIMALAPTMWLLLVGRIVAGIAAATYATASAYMADISPRDQRARNFGLIGAGFGIGFVLGPLLGGIVSTFGLRAPFWFAAGVAFLNLLLGLFALPESLKPENRRGLSWRRANPLGAFKAIGALPGIRPFLIVMFLYTVAFQSYPSIWAFYGKANFGWDGWWIGISLALFGLSIAVVQAALVSPAIRLWGERGTAINGMGLDVGAFVFFGFVTSGFWALVATPITALAGVSGPAIQALMANATPDDQQGELQGVLASIGAVGMTLAPLLMTSVFFAFTREGGAVFWPGAPFVVSAGLMLAAVLVLVVAPRTASYGRNVA